jgi:phosphoglycerate dehydrogenase-like enzyme
MMDDHSAIDALIHFETRAAKPPVFRMTQALIADALARNKVRVRTSLGEDLKDLSWLAAATGFVTSIDVICDPRFPLRELATVAPRLCWIHISGAGIEPLLPLDWLSPQMSLTNNSGVHVEKVRESAAMMLLMAHARVPAIVTNQRQARWQQIFTSTIAGRTVLIVGVGEMGGAVAAAARGLGLHVLGVRRSGPPHPDVDRMYRPQEIDEALPVADVVVLTAPLTAETSMLIDRRRFGLFKRGAGLINIGRAGLIDHAALVDALEDGTVSSAVIDVYDPEPLPPDSLLWHVPNLLLMPHVSSDDEQRYLPKTLDLVFENYRRLAANEPLLNRVDPLVGY